MKLFKLLIVAVLLIATSCQEKKQPVKKNITTTVKHYICKNNCENSGGPTEGICPTCNNPYLHNQAFHNKDFLKAGPLEVPAYDGTQKQNTNTPNQPEPARNSLGVYHYTCTNGCNGGAGSAVNCKECGKVLAHNTAYHNN